MKQSRWLPVFVAIVVALSGCTSSSDEGGSSEKDEGGSSATAGLSVDTETGTFSWEAVDGADQYYVSVAGEGASPWIWIGDETSVEYGDLGDDDPPITLDGGAPKLELQEGITYSWFVTAVDADGEIVEVSGDQTFEL